MDLHSTQCAVGIVGSRSVP